MSVDNKVDVAPPIPGAQDKGRFERKPSTFRNWITPDGSPGPSGEGGFPATAGRYHLYVALPCPWSSRAVAALLIKGLTEVVSLSVLEPTMGEHGIPFGNYPGSSPDPINGAHYLRDIYALADPDYTGRATVPVLWDRERQAIVSNESAEIVRMFDSAFGSLANDHVRLSPEDRIIELDALGAWLYDGLNNAVYRAGFATTQDAYEEAEASVFTTLDEMEQRLVDQPYLAGGEMTEADIRAFVTLVRFDTVYYSLFKCSRRRVADYPALSAYLDRLLDDPALAASVSMDHIKAAYFSLDWINPNKIVPVGPFPKWLDRLTWTTASFGGVTSF